MPQATVPVQLLDLALNTLEDEVKCWRKVPWRPGSVRLMRFPQLSTAVIGPAEIDSESTQEVICHEVEQEIADDLLLRFAMEKVVEAVLGAVSVGE